MCCRESRFFANKFLRRQDEERSAGQPGKQLGEKMKFSKIVLAAFVAALMLMSPLAALAQAGTASAVSTVALSMNVGESVTVSVSGGPVAFVYDGINIASTTNVLSVTTSWNLGATGGSLESDEYFTTPSAALSGPSNITAAQVFAKVNSLPFAACTNTSTFNPAATAGGVCPAVFFVSNMAAAHGTSTSTLTLQLQNLGASLAPGTYSGTLNISAFSSI
jgi:hypothetical protein